MCGDSALHEAAATWARWTACRAVVLRKSRTTLRSSVRHRCYLSSVALHSSPIKSNDVRLPDPQPGEALVVERYSAKHVKAVILHPDDFAELQGGSELLDDLAAAPELGDLGVRAHQIAESPEGDLIDDEASVKRLLGL